MVYICGQEGCAGLVGQQKSVKCNPKCKEQKKTKKHKEQAGENLMTKAAQKYKNWICYKPRKQGEQAGNPGRRNPLSRG